MIETRLKTSEVLDLAADKIEAIGWGTGADTWENDNGAGLCLEGGIVAALGISLWRGDKYVPMPEFQACPVYSAVQNYLGIDNELWRWNDTVGRTKEEVIETLRAAAAVERAKEESLEGAEVTA